MDKKTSLVLLFIIILGGILRLILLDKFPPSLNWDEISHGYNAFSILNTSKDQWGQIFPVINFRAYGDYPTALNLYLTIPFIKALGLSAFSIRLPHALLGILTVVAIYFLGWGVSGRKLTGLVAAFLAATAPWYIFTSRFVLQSNLSVFLLCSAAAFFVHRSKNKYFGVVSFFLLFLTLLSYHTTRIFTPLFLIALAYIYRDRLKNKFILLGIISSLMISAFIVLSPGATARGNVLFIVDAGAVAKIEELRNTSKLPHSFKRLIYNRPVYFLNQFSRKYISYFGPRFLFYQGGTQYQFSLPGHGLIFPFLMPLFYGGLILLVKRAKNNKEYQVLLAWLLLAPIPASLTNESFTVVRATTLMPVIEILISLTFVWLLNKLKNLYNPAILTAFVILQLLFLTDYLKVYYGDYAKNYSWSWQYGYEQVVDYIIKNGGSYNHILVTKKYGEPHEFLLFYLKYNPVNYLNDKEKITFYKDNWWWVDRFDKYWFLNDWEISTNPPELSVMQQTFVTESGHEVNCTESRCLLVTSPGNFPPGWLKVKTIDFLDGSPAFEIYNNR